ncbi:hypothetical protein Btru_048822 [Bulinus truncatus]|nr:hypothetical protein Btru_048822 [Bulinus truncatus]
MYHLLARRFRYVLSSGIRCSGYDHCRRRQRPNRYLCPVITITVQFSYKMQEEPHFNIDDTFIDLEEMGYGDLASILSTVSDDGHLDNSPFSYTPSTPYAPDTPFTPQTPYTPHTPGSALTCPTPLPDEDLLQDQRLTSEDDDHHTNNLLNQIRSLNDIHECHDRCPTFDNQMSVESSWSELDTEDSSLLDVRYQSLTPNPKRRCPDFDDDDVPAKKARQGPGRNVRGFQNPATLHPGPPGYQGSLFFVDINGNNIQPQGRQWAASHRNIPRPNLAIDKQQPTSTAVSVSQPGQRRATAPQCGGAMTRIFKHSDTIATFQSSSDKESLYDQNLNTYDIPSRQGNIFPPSSSRSLVMPSDDHRVISDHGITQNIAQPATLKSESTSMISVDESSRIDLSEQGVPSSSGHLQSTDDGPLTILDPELEQAHQQALALRSQTPLVKYSLKQKILLKKNNKGEDVGDIDFTPKPKPEVSFSPSSIRAILGHISPSSTRAILGHISPSSTRAILGHTSPSSIRAILGHISPSSTRAILGHISPSSIRAILGHISPSSTRAILGHISPSSTRAILGQTSPSSSRAILGHISPSSIRAILGHISPSSIRAILGHISPSSIRAILGHTSPSSIRAILGHISPSSIRAILGHTSPSSIRAILGHRQTKRSSRPVHICVKPHDL